MASMRIPNSSVTLTVAALVALAGAASSSPDPSTGVQHATFQRAVVNLEGMESWLLREAPPSVVRKPSSGGDVWFGEIFRQLPGEEPTSRAHNVPFAVLVRGGEMVRAWCDVNFNGDLTDDPAPALSAYPGDRRARSFRVTLRWRTAAGGRPIEIERLARIVVETPDSLGAPPPYRIQDVYGMLGTLEIGGARRQALLYDGNRDGLYTRGGQDGVFVDLDGDRHFVIDPMAPDFGPFAIPFSFEGRAYRVDSVAMNGGLVVLRDQGAARAAARPEVGRRAPDFSYLDPEGRLVRLSAFRGRSVVLYFWASWCGSCRTQAAELEALYAGRANWDLIGVSYDTDRSAMDRFRADHGFDWPTSFSGGLPAQDPVGRLYQESGAGVFYVIDPEGMLVKRTFVMEELSKALQDLGAKRVRGEASLTSGP